ncbi:MAG: phosphate signaling complex protein PhoU [Oscillospiraceae bacterium]|nr:phosphate signaling complex protein PhoU [Oscillospiraceae bacterium]
MREKFSRQLKQLNDKLSEMGALIESAIANAVQAIDGDKHAIKTANEYEEEIDRKEKEIESLCLKLLLTQQPVASDLRLISAALKMITDMERIGDQAEDIAEIAATAKQPSYIEKYSHVQRMAAATIDMVNKSVDAFVNKDIAMAEEVICSDDLVDALFDNVRDDMIDAIKNGTEHKNDILNLLMIAKYFERIGDHAANIAEWVQFSITGEHKQM